MLKVLERVAWYEEQLVKQTDPLSQDEFEINTRLVSEYYVLRTALEWRQDRLAVAEHMFKKSIADERKLDLKTAESMADLLYEMGNDLLGQKQFELSVKWLDRAFNILMSQDLEKLSSDASELRTSIMQCSVKSLISLERQDAFDKARCLVDLLESEIGDKLVVLLLRLELLESPINDLFDSDAYGLVLQRIITSVVLTETTFKLLMHHIRKLSDKGPGLACKILDTFLNIRLVSEGKEEWIEKALISRLWMATSQNDGPEVIAVVGDVLNILASNLKNLVSASATHAAQTVCLSKFYLCWLMFLATMETH